MRFLDINTGYTFDALWSDGQTNGYTFWFPNEQSVNLTYTMPICMLTDNETPITFELEDNDVFKFISSTKETTSDGFMFGIPTYSYSMDSEVEQIGNGLYVHKIYISCSSASNGEYTDFINVQNYGRIRIGADFYGENESLYINLSNNGVEIPESVQKAIYDSNVHEDYKDNILINRKFKELMSNYWDVVANRGSYKSLINSLNWFEWGDILSVREMWKKDIAGMERYDDREMCSLLENKYMDTMNGFKRTTYLSLYASTQTDGDTYDSEFNPTLENISLKWSKEDLSLKLSILSEFFGSFFLPIHLSIFHSCVEDKIYTNTIKALSGCMTTRNDVFGEFGFVDCNIKDGQTFRIDNVRAQVTKDTIFGITTDMDTRHTHFGVDRFPSEGMVDEESLPTFSSQYYTGPGTIIPIRFTINNLSAREFVKYISVVFTPDNDNEKDIIVFNKQFYTRNNKCEIQFNFLSKTARDYDMVFTFVLSSSKTLTRRLHFSTIDVENLNLSVYKIKSKDDTNGFTYNDFYSMSINDYIFKIQNTTPTIYKQYLPYMVNPNNDYDGVKLNRTVVFDVRNSQNDIYGIKAKMSRYLIFAKVDVNDESKVNYLICVSKHFHQDIPDGIIGRYNVIRNDLGFYPQFHTLERMAGNTINDYTISQYDAICVIPEIHRGGNTYERFKYGHLIQNAEWDFINSSRNIHNTHIVSSQQPIISTNENRIMEDGFYDIVFRYRISNEDKVLRLNSAFRKKTI